MPGRATVVWAVARDPALRRLELSFAGFSFAEQATWLAILVYAFDQGGVREAGVIAIVMLLGAVIVAPFAAFAGDRFRPGTALAGGFVVQASTMGATAAAMWADQPTLTYVAATIVAAAVTFTRPVVAALLPNVARRPSDLIAANVVIGVIADIGLFIGPLLAALILASASPAAVFAVFSVLLVGCAFMVTGLAEHDDRRLLAMDAGALWTQVTGGLRALRRTPPVMAMVFVMGVGAMTGGVVDVLAVTFADVRLDGGGSEAGILIAGLGLGAVTGSLAASGLIGGARLTPFLGLSGVVLSVPFAVLAGIGHLIPAVALFALVGAGQSMLQVTGMVGIQRRAPGRLLARVVGVLESLQLLAMAAGSAAIAILVDVAGLRMGLVVVGIGVVGLFGGGIAWLVAVGGDQAPPPEAVMERLLADPVLSHLEVPAMERIASTAVQVSFPTSTTVIAQGEPGVNYYLVLDGTLAVMQGERLLRHVGSGDAFGEVALLRDTPRTATVRCTSDAELLVVHRDDFLEAVTGHPVSLATADDLTERYLTDDR
jgi:MFS family permease